jgi:hypothetical protein
MTESSADRTGVTSSQFLLILQLARALLQFLRQPLDSVLLFYSLGQRILQSLLYVFLSFKQFISAGKLSISG